MDRRQQIRTAFSGAACRYEAVAHVQDWAAGHMLTLLPSEPPVAMRGLEIGCGTGLLTRRLLSCYPGDWQITDLSPAMLEQARRCGAARYQVLDGERDALPDPPYDLIASNLAFQWFDDLPQAVRRLQAALRPRGWLVFSTMGAGSFQEWRQAHQRAGLSCGLPDYPTAPALHSVLPPGSQVQEQTVPLVFPHAGHFARALKQLGATVPQPGHHPLRAGQMRRVLGHASRPFHTAYHLLFVTVPASPEHGHSP